MKRWGFAGLLAALLLAAAGALGEIGFAEVNCDRVNLRESPQGKRIQYLDQDHSVFVFEEKTVGGVLWCHVYTHVSKRNRDAWIRGDMLRFVSDEFTGVISVQAGDHYVTGLRSDGTVAIIGDDMPHSPCIDTVRTWQNIRQVTSSTCSVYALDGEDRLYAVGRNRTYGTQTAEKLSGNEPVLLDEAGYLMAQTWNWATDGQLRMEEYGLVYNERCIEALSSERMLYGVLTEDGRILCTGEFEGLKHHFINGPYVGADANFQHILALRADGGVDAAVQYALRDGETGDVSAWRDVVKVAAGTYHSLGLRADGTVYYAGDDADHAWQVAHWTDVVDIDAGNGYSIALKSDGSVIMAGAYVGYDR